MTDKKIVTFAVVALVVGLLVGVGVGYAAFHHNNTNTDDNDTYYYYLYFGADNAKNGWYNADATDATAGFDKAMNNAGLTYTVSSWGYVASIDDVGTGWYAAQYLYSNCSSDAAQGSIQYPNYSYGVMSYSNGWKSISGFGSETTLKFSEFNSTIYFLSVYASDYSAVGPDTANDWMTSGPFKA